LLVLISPAGSPTSPRTSAAPWTTSCEALFPFNYCTFVHFFTAPSAPWTTSCEAAHCCHSNPE
jgi:hypothetical protein